MIVEKKTIIELEKKITDIAGIENTQIVGNGQGIEEIQVISNLANNKIDLINNIESILINQYGIPLDSKKIKINKVSSNNSQKSHLRLRSMIIENSILTSQVEVTLCAENKNYRGIAQGSSSTNAKYDLIALATLEALKKAYHNLSFELEDLKIDTQKNNISANITILKKNNIGNINKNNGQVNEGVVEAILSAANNKLNAFK